MKVSRPSVRLPVEEARHVPILELVVSLSLGEPVRRGREYAVCCPLHEDRHTSMRLNSDKNVWYCDVCAVGGGVIELVRAVTRCDFKEAVLRLAS